MIFKWLPFVHYNVACSPALDDAHGRRNSLFSGKTNRTLLTVAGCALAGGIAAYLYARTEAHRYRLEKIRITTDGGTTNGKPPAIIKVLHLSDLHLAEPESDKIEFLRQITDADYDLIVITGDIFENYTGMQYARRLITRAPKLGAFAVLGNHDYYNYTWFNKTFGRINRRFRHPPQKRNVEPFIQALNAAGIIVLRNSSVTLPEHKIHIIGLDYPGTTEQHLKTIAQAPEGFLVLSLLHLPRRLYQLPKAGVHMAFAGHTHGGQVCLPGFGALITDSELERHEASGVIRRGNTVIHVSRGLGTDPKTNFRLFCPPVATLVEVEHHRDLETVSN